MKTKRQYLIEQVLIYSLIVVCILFAIYLNKYVNPKQKTDITIKLTELAELDSQIKEAEIILKNSDKNIEKENLDLRLKKEAVREKFESLFYSSDYTQFIELIISKAKLADITLQNSIYDTPAPEKDLGIYKEFTFSAIFSGEYNKMKRFFWELENSMDFLVNIKNIEIVPPIYDKQDYVSFKLSLSTFLLEREKTNNYSLNEDNIDSFINYPNIPEISLNIINRFRDCAMYPFQDGRNIFLKKDKPIVIEKVINDETPKIEIPVEDKLDITYNGYSIVENEKVAFLLCSGKLLLVKEGERIRNTNLKLQNIYSNKIFLTDVSKKHLSYEIILSKESNNY